MNFVLTTRTDNINLHVEYITTIATRLSEILTSPENLQLQVLNETKWNFNQGLVDTYILDSLVDSISYSDFFEGTIRTASFSWFAMIHETFPESKWQVGQPDTPTVLRPKVIE